MRELLDFVCHYSWQLTTDSVHVFFNLQLSRDFERVQSGRESSYQLFITRLAATLTTLCRDKPQTSTEEYTSAVNARRRNRPRMYYSLMTNWSWAVSFTAKVHFHWNVRMETRNKCCALYESTAAPWLRNSERGFIIIRYQRLIRR